MVCYVVLCSVKKPGDRDSSHCVTAPLAVKSSVQAGQIDQIDHELDHLDPIQR